MTTHKPTPQGNEAAREEREKILAHHRRAERKYRKILEKQAGLIATYNKGVADGFALAAEFVKGRAARTAKKPGGLGRK